MGTTLFGVSKTTIFGILMAVMGISVALQVIQLPADLATPGATHVWHWILFILTVLSAVSGVIVAVLSHDAPAPAAGGK